MTLRTRLERDLREQGTWSATAEALLDALVANVTLAQQARHAADREPFVEGGRGHGVVAHPGLKVAADAEASALRLARELLLSPAALKRAGLDTREAPDDLERLYSQS